MHLTNFVVKVPRAVGSVALTAALKKANFVDQWTASPWAKKQVVRSKRASLSDFDRFKLMLAKKQKRVIVYREAKKLKAAK
jgi:large subunit ribosomal protein L14e